MLMKRIAKLAKEFKKLYDVTGMISINHNGDVQLDPSYFFRQFQDCYLYKESLNQESRFSYRVVANRDGVLFFTLLNKKESEKPCIKNFLTM